MQDNDVKKGMRVLYDSPRAHLWEKFEGTVFLVLGRSWDDGGRQWLYNLHSVGWNEEIMNVSARSLTPVNIDDIWTENGIVH